MRQAPLFPLGTKPLGEAEGERPSCLSRLEWREGRRVLTATGLSSGEVAELAAAGAAGPIEVLFRIPTPDRRLSAALEPGLPPPSMRFASLRAARRAGLAAGVVIAPLVVGVNDVECDVARLLDEARRSGAQFVEFALARAGETGSRRLVRSLRERYPRVAARLQVRRLTSHAGPGEDRARIEEMLERLASVIGVPLRARSPSGESGPRGPGQRRFSFAV